MTEEIRKLKEIIDGSDNIVFFGGAGVSTESGIPDFRSVDGLYRQQWSDPPETILSHTYYERYPEKFFAFYRAKLLCPDTKPNAAHRKLAEWERAGKLKAVITQNIDGLHQAAGSKEVLELHGSTLRNYCERCGKFYGVEAITRSTGVPDVLLRRAHQARCRALRGGAQRGYALQGRALYRRGRRAHHRRHLARRSTPRRVW